MWHASAPHHFTPGHNTLVPAFLPPGPPPLPPSMQQLSGAVELVACIRRELDEAGGDVEAAVRKRARTPQEAGALRELAEIVKRMQQEAGIGRLP